MKIIGNSENIGKGDIKAIVNIPGWAQEYNEGTVDERKDTVKNAAQAYAYVPIVFRAVKLRCDSIAKIPYHFEAVGAKKSTKLDEKEEKDWPFDCDFVELIKDTEASLCIYGASFWLRNNNPYGFVKDLQLLSPSAVTIEYRDKKIEEETDESNNNDDSNKRIKEFVFKYSPTTDSMTEYTQDDVVYFRYYHPSDDIHPGVSPAKSALGDARLLRYMNQFADHFFHGGAMPVTLMLLPGGTPEPERERTERWFKKQVTGIANAFRVLAMKAGGVEVKTITPDLKSMTIPQLTENAENNVARAFGIPFTMLSDAANYATAESHRQSFWLDTVRPDAEWLQEQINRKLLKSMGIVLSFDFDQMDEFQEDEEERSASFYNYFGTGVFKPSWLVSMLGLELPDEVTPEMIDAYYESEKERKEQLSQSMFGNSSDNQDNKNPIDENDTPRKALMTWQRKSLRSLKKGKGAMVDFESDDLSDTLIEAIIGQLETADTIDKVKAIFKDAERWRAYP